MMIFAAAAGAVLSAENLTLDNGVVSATWPVTRDGLQVGVVRDAVSQQTVAIAPTQAWLEFSDGTRVNLAKLAAVGVPRIESLPVSPTAARTSEHIAGKVVVARFADTARHLAVVWRAELREGSRYVRVSVEITNTGATELPLVNLGLVDLMISGAAVVGDFNGSPIVAGTVFLGVEHPLAQNRVTGDRVQGALPRLNPLRSEETARVSAVVGFTDAGQLRRGFLAYLERERAHPYRPFLHHNTWYNIGYFTPFTEGDVRRIIGAFDRELVKGRGVKLDSFVLDDGWDDPKTLWKFSGTGFPHGLKPAGELAAAVGAGMGLWLSPWGGYGKPKQARLEFGTAAGFETREGSFSLAGPRYYERFRALCTDVLRDDHVGYFKFDGIGSQEGPDRIDPAASRDFEAMMRLIAELRAISPDVFINQTTGTWPSPFWLLQVDSIWRGGEDHDFTGVGSFRQRWITYRDADTYKNIVRRGPLYPVNSLMIHGIIFAAHAKNLQTDPGGDFTAEVRSYFGSGTQLQEMYISPELLSPKNWDDLAAAARWSRANAAVLIDTHWIGGDPEKLAVYGWAAWTPAKGVITLRNPSDHSATFAVDVGKIFELPADAPRSYVITTAYADTPAPTVTMKVGAPVAVELPAFGVLVLEATPNP